MANAVYSTGNEIVDVMIGKNFTGNVIPQTWYKTVTWPANPKPYLLAIVILSDIVYWYRPQEIRDEGSGAITGFRKRFRSDLLQRSYDQLADMYGETKRSITAAVVRLEQLGGH